MEGLERCEAPHGQGGDPGSGDQQDKCAGASGGGRRPDHALLRGRGQGERYRRSGLRSGRPYPSAGGLGKATRIVRRRRSGEQAALGPSDFVGLVIYGVEDRALVMELVDGETLHGPLSLETALNYARQIADALEAL